MARQRKASVNPHRLAIVASHVIQYQAPLFRLIARQPDIDLEVLYCSPQGAAVYHDADMKTTLRWDLDLLEGYRHRFLFNFSRDLNRGFWRHVNPGIVPALSRGGYDAVLFMLGWGSFTALLGMIICRVAGIPFFVFGDSSFPPPEDTLRARIRARLLRVLFGMTTGFTVSGSLNADYYRHYGADPERFFLVPWAIDNDRFAAACRFEPAERDTLRERFRIAPDSFTIVFSAKLVERKDPMTLLRAYEQMRHRSRASLLLLGDGPMRQELETYAQGKALNDVHFAGFLNQSDLPKHYGIGDVFVLPSLYEPRGAVINEAMACGLPVIVTDRCGSIGDIVLSGENAFIYPAGDAAALAGRLDALAEDAGLRERMGRRSREIIATWSFDRGVAGVREALQWVRSRRHA